MSLLQEVVDELTVRLQAPTGISDLQLDTLAAGPHPFNVDWMRRESLLGRVAPNTSRDYYAELGVRPTITEPMQTPEDSDRNISARWVLPACWNAVTYGYIWILNEGGTSVSAEQIKGLQEYCDRVGEYIHRRTARLRDHAASVQDLLISNRRSQHETATRLYDTMGYPPGPVGVVVLALAPGGERLRLPTSVLDGPFPRAVPGEVWRVVEDRRAVLLVPPSTVGREGAVERVAEHAKAVTDRELKGRGSVVVGIGDPVASLFEAAASFRQARLAIRAASAIPGVPPIVAWADLGALRAVVSIPDDSIDDAVAPGVMRLCEEAPFLAETLEVYFGTGANVQETCDLLSVSRGTVYYRLQRAEAISGLSLKKGLDRMTLEIGLALMRMRTTTTSKIVELHS